MHKKNRCGWVNNEQIYLDYHDLEWGIPLYDKQKLFELFCLETQHAGLSWLTILRKRENYRKAFFNFDPIKIVKNANLEELMQNAGIVRHQKKIESIINAAKIILEMEKNGENFSDFIWSFVENKPIYNRFKTLDDVPTKTEISVFMSNTLKKRGFKFVGSITCYAFMQAAGLVNDHVESCDFK